MCGDTIAHWTEMWVATPYSVAGPQLEGTSRVDVRYDFGPYGPEMVGMTVCVIVQTAFGVRQFFLSVQHFPGKGAAIQLLRLL